ncbi:MAG: hypothetical protein GX804_03860 [Lentisphaerae bacterium]|jgi:hypothetical protein|nr:hypothetical protein [Lentisphaerota bacterium]
MKQICTISLSIIMWLVTGLELQSAEPISQDAELCQLFDAALDACDLEYQKIRDRILAHEDAVIFLAKRVQDTNLVSRVIARAMQTWMNDNASNMMINRRLADIAGRAMRNIIGERAILGSIYELKSEPELRRFAKIDTDVNVLLEVALKGPTFPDEPGNRKNIKSHVTNCYAAGLSGLYDDPDIVPILIMLTDEKEDYLMRNAALRGLRLREDVDMAVFLKGMEDKEELYRKVSYLHLRDTTGQDFGYDAEKYRMWLETNTVNRAAQPAK